MPTIVNGRPSSMKVEPTILGSAAYSCCHTRWLSMAAGAAEGSSLGRKCPSGKGVQAEGRKVVARDELAVQRFRQLSS